jgi:hypothetical protein
MEKHIRGVRIMPNSNQKLDQYLSHAPWAQDERLFPVAMSLDDNGYPEIQWLRRREFPNMLRNSSFNYWLRKGIIEDFRCILTESRIYFLPSNILENTPRRQIPWTMTREHLFPLRNRASLKSEESATIFPCSSIANNKFGHMPLIMKLYIRDKLATCEWDRESMTPESSLQFLSLFIKIERSMAFQGRYPWQPHTYIDGQEKQAVLKFYDFLIAEETKIFLLPTKQRRQVCLRPIESDIEGALLQFLGKLDG